MARKRLNKKVALIGSTVLLLVILGIVAIILRLGRDPETFIKDGDAAWLAKDYKTAQRNYLKAHNYAKSPDLKIEILFKLADMYIETDEWPKVRGCWEQIINIDTRNVEARLARFKYVYTVADIYASAGRDVGTVWKEVQSQASELVEVAEEKGLPLVWPKNNAGVSQLNVWICICTCLKVEPGMSWPKWGQLPSPKSSSLRRLMI